MAEKAAEAPEISLVMAIEPSIFPPNNAGAPTLSMTTTSHASRPITIFTWPTVLYLRKSQSRYRFKCVDLTSNTPVETGLTHGVQRKEYDRAKGSFDDEHFVTLKPGKPVKFEHSFGLAKRYAFLEKGHRYQYAIKEGEVIQHWWYGTRSDILVRSRGPVGLLPSSGPPIALDTAPAVEFEVEECDEASLEKPSEEPGLKESVRGRCVSSIM